MKRSAYYVLAGDFTWRRSTNLFELINHYSKLDYDYVIYQMIFENCDDTELENMMCCFSVEGLGIITQCSNLSKEDMDMLDKYFIGWVYTEVKSKKKKSKV